MSDRGDSRQEPLRRRGTWILLPWIALAPVLAGACGGQGSPEGTTSTSSPIYAGVEDDDAQQNPAVVAVEVDNGGTSMFELCSGVLVAPNVVLTARHCVSVQNNTAITCDQNGVSATPPDFGADEAIGIIHVFTGPAPALLGTPAASAVAVFHPAGTTQCNLDLALVVLDRPITGIQPLRVRLAGPVTTGESVRTVGYGQNDQNAPIGTRFRKDDVSVLAVGSNEFEMGESMCNGDSGGPAIDEMTGAVVGIVSRGGACTDTTGHIYTSLAGFPVFQQAFAMAGGAPITENEPYPDAGAGPAPTGSASGPPAPSGTGTTGTGPEPARGNGAPVNLRAGQGSGCSLAGLAGQASSGASLMLVVMLALAIVARRRAARQPVRYSSKHGRFSPPVRASDR
jgi:V8-like Glu-specific endopeptidase